MSPIFAGYAPRADAAEGRPGARPAPCNAPFPARWSVPFSRGILTGAADSRPSAAQTPCLPGESCQPGLTFAVILAVFGGRARSLLVLRATTWRTPI